MPINEKESSKKTPEGKLHFGLNFLSQLTLSFPW